MNKKFTEAVSANIDKNREEKEFWKLLESKNDDNYGVKQRMREWGIYSASSLLYGSPHHKFLKNTLFEMFLTKKIYDTEKFEVQKKGRDSLTSFTKEKTLTTLQKLKTLSDHLKRAEFELETFQENMRIEVLQPNNSLDMRETELFVA